MSKVSVACPNCSAVLTVPADILGRKIKCPKCNEVVRLPTAAERKAGGTPAVHASDATGTPGSSSDSSKTASKPKSSKAPSTPAIAPKTAESPGTVETPGSVERPAGAPKANLVMAKPVVPMASVVVPDSVPAADASSKTPILSAGIGEPVEPRERGPSFSGLDSKLVAVTDKPRVKLPRKRSNPWPMILIGMGALSVLTLIVIVLVMYVPSGGGEGPAIPQIQFVSDSRTEVGKTVRIPIAVHYPAKFTDEDKRRWQLSVGQENPAGVEWDSATGHLTWSPGIRDAGKSHALTMMIKDSVTLEPNVVTFQVHVPALLPSIMTILAYWDFQGLDFTVSLPSESEAMGQGEVAAKVVDLLIGEHLIRAFAFPNQEVAAMKFAEIDSAEIDQDVVESSEVVGGITPPWRFANRDGLILVTSQESLDAVPAIKAWFQPNGME